MVVDGHIQAVHVLFELIVDAVLGSEASSVCDGPFLALEFVGCLK